MRVIVMGSGKVGYYLTRTLIEHKHHVNLIESDEELCKKVATELDMPVIHGDGTHLDVLMEANVKDADYFIAVTGKDETNLISCQLAKIKFGVKKTIARVNNPKNLPVMQSLGIDIAVSSTGFIAGIIERQMDDANTRFLTNVMGGQISVKETLVEKGSFMDGKKVSELDLPIYALLISILRQGKMIIPRGNIGIKAGDVVIAICPPEHKNALRGILDDLFVKTQE